MIEEANQDLLLLLATAQIPLQLIVKLTRRAGTPPTRRWHLVRLHRLVPGPGRPLLLQELQLRHLLRGVEAEEVMAGNLLRVPPDLSLQNAADHYFMRYDHGAFPVDDIL